MKNPSEGAVGRVARGRSLLRRVVAAAALTTGLWIGLALADGSVAHADTSSASVRVTTPDPASARW